MIRIKKYMLLDEKYANEIIMKYRLRESGDYYTEGCPIYVCSPSLHKIYNGCKKDLNCNDCWNRFLDDIIIGKRSNTEVYNE